MGYRDDPFFSINWAGDARDAGPRAGGKENAPFLFPDRSVRFLDAQSELQRRFNNGIDTISRGSYKVHRGYIRSLEQPNIGEIPISKCNFQFNPQEIRQNVQMREDMYIPLLQDIKQLAQPVGAVVNFTFDLLFDRSHEVSKGRLNSTIPSRDISADAAERTGGVGTSTSSADPLTIGDQDPYDIGVLADLRVLYSVIGQGFSKEMLDFQKARYNAKIDVENNKLIDQFNADKNNSSGDDAVEAPTLKEVDQENLDKILTANYGNFGLLMPNPVRVMFSSLFMLDGFITGTNVDFLKFNSNMVPLMSRVTMNMMAMYIGFAKERTFLVDTFLAAAKALEEDRAKQAAEVAEVKTALQRTASQFVLSAAWDSSTLISWDTAAQNAHPSNRKLDIWALAVSDDAASDLASPPNERALFLGFPLVKPVRGGDTYKYVEGDKVQTREGADKDSILTLFELGSGLTVSYSWSIKVYGGKTEATALSLSEAQNLISRSTYATDTSVKLLGSFSGSETASSKADWGAGTSSPGSDAERVRRRSIRGNDDIKNSAEDRYYADNSTDVPSWFKDAYYVVETEVTIDATVNGEKVGSTVRSSVDALNNHLYKKFAINWNATGSTNGYRTSNPSGTFDNSIYDSRYN